MKKEDLTLEEILFLLKNKYESNNLKTIIRLKNKINKMEESYAIELNKTKKISSDWRKSYLELNKNTHFLYQYLYETGKNKRKISKEDFLNILHPLDTHKQDENIYIIHD